MPTRRWMYIAPICFFCVAVELTIMFGIHWDQLKGVPSALEELTGKFYVFIALMVGQAGLWGYLLSLCGEWISQIWSFCKNGPSFRLLPVHYRAAIVTRFIFVWVAVGAWYYIVRQVQPDWNLGPYQHHINIRDAGVPGFLVGALGISGMWLVEVAMYSSLPTDGKVNRSQLSCYLRLRDYLARFLTVTGIVLALGTLDLNASRDFIKTANPDNFFPQDLIAVFGGVFTVLLGISYAPPYLALRELGCNIRDSIVPGSLPEILDPTDEPDEGAGEVRRWFKHRKNLGDVLQLEIRNWKSFGPQVSIVAPLITGLASRLIGGK